MNEFDPEKSGYIEAYNLPKNEFGADLQRESMNLVQISLVYADNLRRRSDVGSAVSDLYQRAAFPYAGDSPESIRNRTKILGSSLETAIRNTTPSHTPDLKGEIAKRRSGVLAELGVRFALEELGLKSYFKRLTPKQVEDITPQDVAADTREKNDMWIRIDTIAESLDSLGVPEPKDGWSRQNTFATQVKGLPINPRALDWVARPIQNEFDVRQAADAMFDRRIWPERVTNMELEHRKAEFLDQMLGVMIKGNFRSGFLDTINNYSKYSNVGGLLVVIPTPTESEQRKSMIVETHGGLTRQRFGPEEKPTNHDLLPDLSQKLLRDLTLHFSNESKLQLSA